MDIRIEEQPCPGRKQGGSANTVCRGGNITPWIILMVAIFVILFISTILVIARCYGFPVLAKWTLDHLHCPEPCAAGWIGYEGKCYFFSEEEGNWTHGQNFCSSHGSLLARIETELEKVFLLRYKGRADHWIGLSKDQSEAWKWADGAEFRNMVAMEGEGGGCAFLSTGTAIASRCHIPRNWICSHPGAYTRGIH